MSAPVHMQKHPPHRPPLSLQSMNPPTIPLRQQPSRLQRTFDPGIAQLNPILLPKLLVKMPPVPSLVALPIEPKNLLHRLHRHPPRTWPPLPPIKKPVVSPNPIPSSPPPKGARTPSQNLRRIQPTDPLRHRPHNHLLNFHDPPSFRFAKAVHAPIS